MYNTKKEKKYFMYSFSNHSLISFNNFDELIEYIRLKNRKSYNYKILENDYLENISLNYNDNKIKFIFGEYTEYYEKVKREYLFYDEDFKIIDLRIYSDLIITKNDIKIAKENNFLSYNYFSNKEYLKQKKGYIYRKTPVSGIHKINNVGIPNSNRTKYLKEMKINQDIEEKYLRKKRVNSLKENRNYDIYNRISKSWKDQTKKKKQWMK